MIVVIVDTNVVVSGLLTNDASAPTAVILDRMIAGSIRFVLSAALVAEYRSVLLRPKIVKAHGRTEAAIDALLTELVANGIVREASASGDAAPDPGDNHIWALAQTQQDAVIVTGDQLLLDSPPAGVTVLTPRAFLDLD